MSDSDLIHLTSNMVNNMLNEAQQGKDKEICGLLAIDRNRELQLYPIKNIAELPQCHYLMDPKQQIHAFKSMRERNESLFGIYHSHPKGPAYPSATDIRDAHYADCIYFIISMNIKGVLELGAFKIIDNQKFKKLTLTIGEKK